MNELVASARAFGRSFRTPALAKALTALIAFSMTEWAALVAVAVYAFQEGGTARVGLVSTIMLVVAAIVAPLGSVLGDRYRRERVLLLAYLALTLGTGATAITMLAGSPPAAVYAAAIASAAVLTLVRPTHQAVLPGLAPTSADLTAAYAASGLIQSACVMLGPLLAAIIFASSIRWSGPGVVNAVLTVLLVVGSALVATVRPSPAAIVDESPAATPSVRREVAEGIRTAWRDPRPRLLVGLMGLATFTLGVIDILIVVLAFEVLGTGDAGVGLLNVSLGMGAIVGAGVAAIVTGRRRLFGPFRAAVLATGAPITLTGAIPVGAAPLLGVSACGMALGNVVGVTMLQRLIPDAKLTRVFGVLESMYMAGEGAGTLTASIVVLAVGPRWTLFAAGLLLPVVGFAVRHRIEVLDVGVRVPEHEIEVLRRSPIFGVLPGPSLERIARNAVPAEIEAGTEVIHQGDQGDAYYVVESGTFDVLRDGRTVGELGSGDGFGEIALLRDVPRTATVTATSRARLLALHRDEFLRALTGEARASAHEEASRRLPDDE